MTDLAAFCLVAEPGKRVLSDLIDAAALIRLTASASDHGFTFTLAQDGLFLLTTGNTAEAAGRMLVGLNHRSA